MACELIYDLEAEFCTIVWGDSQPLQVSYAWERGSYMADKPEPIVFKFKA